MGAIQKMDITQRKWQVEFLNNIWWRGNLDETMTDAIIETKALTLAKAMIEDAEHLKKQVSKIERTL